ncbi:MAG: hypothetical protein QM736_01530 [Vicinamibacterales bacterium]
MRNRSVPCSSAVCSWPLALGMLAERSNLLPAAWRTLIWPVLLMAFGIARLAQPARRGRRGLFYVLAGAWWFAGLSDWLSFEQTWPLLIVAFGRERGVRSGRRQPELPAGSFPRRHSGGMSWVFVAILVGTFISAGGGNQRWSELTDRNGHVRSVAVAGRTEHRVESDASASPKSSR